MIELALRIEPAKYTIPAKTSVNSVVSAANSFSFCLFYFVLGVSFTPDFQQKMTVIFKNFQFF